MRISNLSQQAGLPVGTVKFYLRTGLLHAGRSTSATQALYDDSHLRRLRLVRALLEVGRLPLAEIQRILDVVDATELEPGDRVEAVRASLARQPGGTQPTDLGAARALLDELGWTVAEDSPHLPALARALSAMDTVGLSTRPERLRSHAEAAHHAATSDCATVDEASTDEAPLVAATTAVLHDALLVALRRLATEDVLTRRSNPVPAPRMSLPGA